MDERSGFLDPFSTRRCAVGVSGPPAVSVSPSLGHDSFATRSRPASSDYAGMARRSSTLFEMRRSALMPFFRALHDTHAATAVTSFSTAEICVCESSRFVCVFRLVFVLELTRVAGGTGRREWGLLTVG